MSENNTGKTVYYTSNPAKPYRLTPEERARLDSIRDEDIDFSDIPPQTGLKDWYRPGLFGGAQGAARKGAVLKEKLLVLDEDVVRLFEENGEISAEKLNAVLREYAETHRSNA
jgi:hypothetical protein